MPVNNSNLIWIDLEMTGLDTQKDDIIEIATIVTDKDLNILEEGPVFAISHPATTLQKMDAWNQRQHNASGLVERIKNSSTSMQTAEQETIAFLQRHLEPQKSPMCGNSICQDRRFLARQMPALEAFFHYRNLDVSTLKELVMRWAPEMKQGLRKDCQHLALEDVKDSIKELKYYRESVFKI